MITELGDTSRRAREAAIRVVDLIVYALVVAAGVFALIVPPETVQRWLSGWEWVALLWGWLLIIAGILGFAGRLTRVWAVEIPGPIAALFGLAIYVLILGAAATRSVTVWVALSIVVIAGMFMLRRYVELLIFSTDPKARGWFGRRTSDAAAHR